MLPFIMAHLAWFILVGTAFIFLMGGVSLLNSFIVSQRLHHLSIDVITNDAETFQHTHVIACQTCKGKRHVSHYRYGRGNQERSVYVCYLCVPRLEQHIRRAYQEYLSMHPKEQPKDVSYAQFQAWTGQAASSSTDPYTSCVPRHQAHKKGW